MAAYLSRKINDFRSKGSKVSVSGVVRKLRSSLRRMNSLTSENEPSDGECFDEITSPEFIITEALISSPSSSSTLSSVVNFDPVINRVLKQRPTVHRKSDIADESFLALSATRFVSEALRSHNELRALHNSPPLELSVALCKEAQNWANFLAHSDAFLYRNHKGIGENLLLRCSNHLIEIDMTAEQVTRHWYKESAKYAFNMEEDRINSQASQFTQMVWKSSRLMGIGKARTRTGKLIVVANYVPPGNIPKEFRVNVFPKQTPTVSDDIIYFD